jgi:hypothetical protein
MLLLDTSFLVEFERELAARVSGPAAAVLRAHARRPAAISIVSFGEFAEGFSDPRDVIAFLSPFRVLQVSRAIALRMPALQSNFSRRLGENDAWIAATALSYDATLVGRERAFERVPRLDYLRF